MSITNPLFSVGTTQGSLATSEIPNEAELLVLVDALRKPGIIASTCLRR